MDGQREMEREMGTGCTPALALAGRARGGALHQALHQLGCLWTGLEEALFTRLYTSAGAC
jgi:hypothetical protein